MKKERAKKAKPLSFTTTLRNPERIANFLDAVSPFEGQVLTNALIHKIVKNIIGRRLYYTEKYQMKHSMYKTKYKNETDYTDKELEDIIANSPQEHKEAGFDRGWPSRFDTWYEMPKEFGFIFYEIGKPIVITQTGHMLIDAVREQPHNNEKIQSVFLNAMMKYQIDNPFRRNANNNNPLVLLLKTITVLRRHYGETFSGIFRQELPLFICFPDDNVDELVNIIVKHRKKYRFNYGNEIIYNMCLKLLNTTNTKLYKFEKITKEAVDDYIRKMRITGVLSLRGNGRFLDINKFEEKKIGYILQEYAALKTFANEQDYISYMGSIDANILEIKEKEYDKTKIKIESLTKWSNQLEKNVVLNELKILGSGRKGGSDNELLRVLDEPTRLEFLTSVALKQNLENVTVLPNYSIDDEGLPTFTASGGIADIECFDKETQSLFEVTLMTNKAQAVNEIPAITRHLQEKKNNYISIFIAPFIHADSIYMIGYSRERYKVEIFAYTILEFVEHITKNSRLKSFVL